MGRILQKLGLEPIIARELEAGLLNMVLAAFSLWAIHTVGLSVIDKFNQISSTTEAALPAEAVSKGKEVLTPLQGLMKGSLCESEKTNKRKGDRCP